MANLSNINGKFVVEQTTGFVGIGTTDPGFLIEAAGTNAELALNAGSIYRLRSTAGNEFIITKNGVGDRLTISSGGDATFSGKITTTALQPSYDTNYYNVDGTISSYSASNYMYVNGLGGASGQGLRLMSEGAATNIIVLENSNNSIIFNTNSTLALTLDNSQNATFAGNVQVTGALKDSSGDAGTSGQILSSTATGTNWIDNDTGSVKGTGTATRVAFWSASDTISSNADLYWDNSNDRLGLGTTSPTHTLHVKNSSGDVRGVMIEQAESASYAEIALKSDIREFRLGTGGDGTNNANAENLFYIYDATTSGVAGHRFEINSVGDVQARRPRSNTAGDVALSLQPTDTTAHYGWRIDQATNSLNLDYVNTPLNLVSYSTTGNATFVGTVTAPTFLGDLNGTINTVTTAVTKGNATNDTTVATTAFVQNVVGTIPAGLVFQGTWNASTNTPTLSSGSGTTGHFYIVSVAGSTNLDGITDWQVGDWAVFIEQGASDQWEKIDNSSVLSGSGTGGSFAGWSGSGTSVTLGNAPVTFSGNNSTFAGNVTISKSDTAELQLIDTTNNVNLIIAADDNNAFLRSSSGAQLLLQTNGGTSALTLDSSQNATFAGVIHTTKDGGAVAAISTPRIRLRTDGVIEWGPTYNSGTLTWDTNKAVIAAQSGNALELKANNSTLGLTIATTGNATFSGAVNVKTDKVQIDQDGTYGGSYATVGFGGKTNGSNRIFGATGTGDGLFLASATGRGIFFRIGGGAVDNVSITATGDVAIGTATPYAFDTTATKFHVKNDAGAGNVAEVARFEGSSDADGSGGTIRLGTSNDRGIYFEGGRTGSVPYGIIGTTEYNGAKTYSIYLQNTGNVGIGTTSPLGKLMVRDDTAGSPTRIIVNNGGTAQSGTAARLSFYEGTTETNYIERRRDGSGHFAFKSPADDNPFVWENASGEFLRFVNSAVLIGQTSNVSTHLLTVNGRIGGPTFSDSYLQFTGGNALLKANDDVVIGYSSSLYVKQSGNVGIGTTSPDNILTLQAAAGSMHQRFKEASTTIGFIGGANGIIGGHNGKLAIRAEAGLILSSQGNSADVVISSGNASFIGSVTAAADVVAYSDERLKSDIKTLNGSKVYDMRGVTFIKDNKQSSGVIAQELEKIAPELVNNDSEFKAVAYGNLTGYLIEAVKELKAEIEELKKHSCDCKK